jgi:hypothetical protein
VPAGPGKAFIVSLASRRAAAAAVTSYNGLRSGRRRLARRGLGLALRAGIAGPALRTRIDVGVAAGVAAGVGAGADRDAAGGALLTEHVAALFGASDVVLACGGGAGPYRKPVLQVFSSAGTPLGYLKIGWNDWSRDAVRREAEALRACAAASRPGRLEAPALLHQGRWRDLELIATAPLPRGVRRPNERGLADADLLRAISELSPTGAAGLAASTWWTELRARIDGGTSAVSRTRLSEIADSLERAHGQVRLDFGRWHGDLVPWNLARLGPRLFAWDWESSAACAPVGLDALHFHFQVAFVARRQPLGAAFGYAQRQAAATLTSLGLPAQARGVLPGLHLLELAVRHEEARESTGDSDERFYPAVLDVLANWAGGPAVAPGEVKAGHA